MDEATAAKIGAEHSASDQPGDSSAGDAGAVGPGTTSLDRFKETLRVQNELLKLLARAVSTRRRSFIGLRFWSNGCSRPSYCVIQLVDESGRRLQHGTAPTLPIDLTKALDDTTIDPASQPDGRGRAYHNRRMISVNIGTDPLCNDFSRPGRTV